MIKRKVFLLRDYWKMTDADIETLTEKYLISPYGRAGKDGEHWFVDRERIIPILTARDSALIANWSLVISAIALVVSLISVVIAAQ